MTDNYSSIRHQKSQKRQMFGFLLSHLSPLSPLSHKASRGFTFVEMLTVMGIFAVIGTLAVSIVSMTLRGSKKSDAIELIRQSGNEALSKMVRTVRYAKTIDSPSCTPSFNASAITVSSLDDKQTTFSCDAPVGTITVNNTPMVDANIVSVKNCSFVCTTSGLGMPSITIDFTLESKTNSKFFEDQVAIPFQTTVTMRNISQ